MTSDDVRHENFMALYRDFRAEHSHLPNRGMLKLFGEHVGISDRYLSHIKGRRRAIGSLTARRVEKACKRPHGWLDVPHRMSNDPTEQFLLDSLKALYRSAPDLAKELVMEGAKKKLDAIPA